MWACPWRRDGGRVRDHKPIDNGSGPNVPGRDNVGVASEATSRTSKSGLVRPVGPVNVAAGRTGTRGIARIDKMNLHPCKLSFIGDELAELPERPFAVARSLGLVYRYPVADPGQLFERQVAAGVNGLGHQLLADAVVGIGFEPAFSPAHLLEPATAGLGADPLKPAPASFVMPAGGFNLGPAVLVAIGIGGQVDDAQVHADHLVPFGQGRLWQIDGRVQKKRAVAVDQVGLALDPVDSPGLVLTEDDRDQQPARQGQYRHPVNALPGQDTLIVDDSAVWPEAWLDRTVPLVGFDHLGNRPDGQLGRQFEALSNVLVDQLLQGELVDQIFPVGYLANGVAGGVEPLHCRKECGGLLGRG